MNALVTGKVLRLFLTCLTLLCAAAIIATYAVGAHTSIPVKQAASVGFVLLGVTCGATRTGYGRTVLAGLLCCAAGDFIGPFNFMAGLAAFLLGHLFYFAAFAIYGITARRLSVAAPVALLTTGAALSWLYPHVPRSDVIPILAYITVITTMLTGAIASSEGKTGKLILAAAVIFYISDIFVARWKYVDHSSTNGMFCYPLYYIACTCFAWTPLLYLRQKADQ